MALIELASMRVELRRQLNEEGKAIMHIPDGSKVLIRKLKETARSWANNHGTEVRCVLLDTHSLYVEETEVV